MSKIKKGSVSGFRDIQVPYSINSNEEEAKGLAIMFPGGGYTAQRPAFHYATELFLSKSYHVLSIDYQYASAAYDAFSIEEMDRAIVQDSKTVIDKVLDENHGKYEDFCLVGKSIGTIALSAELKRKAFHNAKVVWLTPLLTVEDVFNSMLDCINKSLVIIGENDPYYKIDLFNKLKQIKNMDAILIPGINHSLQYENNVIESIDIMRRIIREMEGFIHEN